MDYRKLFADVRQRPGMFGLDGSFHDFTVFVQGCEAGNDWQLLAGFREWLIPRLDEGDSSLAWVGLVRRLAFPGNPLAPGRDELVAGSELNAVAVETLFQLLDEFLQRRERWHDGDLVGIFNEYLTWRNA